MAAATKMMTMYLFFAENSMIFSIMLVFSLSLARRGLGHLFKGGLQARLRVDEEVRRGDHLFSFGDSAQDLINRLAFDAELDFPWLQIAVPLIDDSNLFIAGIDDGVRRDSQSRPVIDVNFQVGVHLGLKLERRVRNFDSDPDGAGFGVQVGVDIGNCALERLSGIIRQVGYNLLAFPDEGK